MKNEILFTRIKKLVSIERRIGVEILELLYEIEARKAYTELKYDGLFTYCVRELGFSDAQAYQRIQAMRALKDLPELKPLIESGSLSVSSVSKIQTHLRQEKRSGKPLAKPARLELFQAMENCSSREVDRKLYEAKGEKPKAKLVLEMDEELEMLWNQAKDLAAHRSQGNEAEVLKILAKEWLKRNDPTREVKTPKKLEQEQAAKSSKPPPIRLPATHEAVNVRDVSQHKRTPIPAALRREVFRKDQNQCTRCRSRYALEIDHIKPVALGGRNEKENLRLLCRSCNRFSAIQVFGRIEVPIE